MDLPVQDSSRSCCWWNQRQLEINASTNLPQWRVKKGPKLDPPGGTTFDFKRVHFLTPFSKYFSFHGAPKLDPQQRCLLGGRVSSPPKQLLQLHETHQRHTTNQHRVRNKGLERFGWTYKSALSWSLQSFLFCYVDERFRRSMAPTPGAPWGGTLSTPRVRGQTKWSGSTHRVTWEPNVQREPYTPDCENTRAAWQLFFTARTWAKPHRFDSSVTLLLRRVVQSKTQWHSNVLKLLKLLQKSSQASKTFFQLLQIKRLQLKLTNNLQNSYQISSQHQVPKTWVKQHPKTPKTTKTNEDPSPSSSMHKLVPFGSKLVPTWFL